MKWLRSIAYSSPYGIILEVVIPWQLGSWRVSIWNVDLLFDVIWSNVIITWWWWSSCLVAKVPGTPCWGQTPTLETRKSSGVHLSPYGRDSKNKKWNGRVMFCIPGLRTNLTWFLFDLLCKRQDCRVSRLHFISFCLARVFAKIDRPHTDGYAIPIWKSNASTFVVCCRCLRKGTLQDGVSWCVKEN